MEKYAHMEMTGSLKKSDQVRNRLTDWLKGVEPGTRLLPQRHLAELLKVSRPTIQKAIESLVNEGVLVRKMGSGIFVSNTASQQRLKVCVLRGQKAALFNIDFGVSLFSELQQAMQDREYQYTYVTLQETKQNTTDFSSLSSEVFACDGILIACDSGTTQLPEGIPVVSLMNWSFPSGKRATQVVVDDYVCGVNAAAYLIALGHKKLAFVGDMKLYSFARNRLRGICDTASDASLPEPTAIQISSQKPIGLRSAQAIKDCGATAVICSNDSIAMSQISALHKLGLRVPEDVSVIGFDDIPASSLFEPPLTTVRLPIHDAVITALDELERLISSPNNQLARRIILSTEVIERNSCKANQ